MNIERTAAVFRAQVQRLLRPRGLSPAAYNVLRILRGYAPEARTCNQIKADMVTPVPDLTRLADRLAGAGLVRRSASAEDRRAVLLSLTDAGRTLLAELDRPVAALHRDQLAGLRPEEQEHLSRLLTKARRGAKA